MNDVNGINENFQKEDENFQKENENQILNNR